jgi:hypothetical protein
MNDRRTDGQKDNIISLFYCVGLGKPQGKPQTRLKQASREMPLSPFLHGILLSALKTSCSKLQTWREHATRLGFTPLLPRFVLPLRPFPFSLPCPRVATLCSSWISQDPGNWELYHVDYY